MLNRKIKTAYKDLESGVNERIQTDKALLENEGKLAQVLRDITETKKMQQRLQQSQKMEAIGTLAGGIAHDFNNILFPFIGHTEMLMKMQPIIKEVLKLIRSTIPATIHIKQDLQSDCGVVQADPTQIH